MSKTMGKDVELSKKTSQSKSKNEKKVAKNKKMDAEKKKKEKIPNPVYSARIDAEIQSAFKSTCDRFNVDHKYIMSEYMKKFVVLNNERESFEKAILFDNEISDTWEES